MDAQGTPPPELLVLPAFLRSCSGVDTASTALMFGAMVILALNLENTSECAPWHGAMLGASLLAGIVEKYFALRVKFDLKLFEAVAENRLDSESLDAGLAALFPQSAPSSAREWRVRVHGAVRLAYRQLLVFTLQVLFLAALALFLALCL